TCLDADLQRFLIQKTIDVDPSADVVDIIKVLSKYIRSQRNPLLDRIEFYKASQDGGEMFDNFFTRLREIFLACNFESDSTCSTCRNREDDLMRDRIVCYIMSDTTRHRLLAEQDLTLEKAVKICQAEEGASASQKNFVSKELQDNIYEFYSHHCGKPGHFSPCCKMKGSHYNKNESRTPKHMSAIQVAGIEYGECLHLETKTRDGEWTRISWIPDTGSNVEDMDLKTFKKWEEPPESF
ncbi:hypothetical protein TCAL_12230, partial [Tigriopus californicus]